MHDSFREQNMPKLPKLLPQPLQILPNLLAATPRKLLSGKLSIVANYLPIRIYEIPSLTMIFECLYS